MQPLPAFRSIIVIDVRALTHVDADVIEALARLQLAAHRLGASIRLQNAPDQLVDLLTLLGLSDTFLVRAESGVEVNRQAEEREEVRIDEVVDRGDLAL